MDAKEPSCSSYQWRFLQPFDRWSEKSAEGLLWYREKNRTELL